MTTRFSQKDDEQDNIQAQFDVSRAKSAIDELTDRIESLHSLGRLIDKDSKELSKLLKTIRDKIEKAQKK